MRLVTSKEVWIDGELFKYQVTKTAVEGVGNFFTVVPYVYTMGLDSLPGPVREQQGAATIEGVTFDFNSCPVTGELMFEVASSPGT